MGAAAAAAGITAVGSIAGAAISSSKGGSSSSQAVQTDSSHTPWGPQAGAIGVGLDQAGQVFADRTAQGPYTGALYAPQNDTQKQAQGYATGYANGTGNQLTGLDAETAQASRGALASAENTSGYVAANGLGPQNGALTGALTNYATGAKPTVDSALSDSLNASATAGAKTIGGYNAGLSGIMSSAQSDPTQQLAGDAQTYMNSGATQQMLDNVNGQIDNTLNETTVPGLNRQAAMGGNLNSSRAGMAEAMANRDAALAKGNADSQILNNAYNTGLGVASTQHTAGLNTAASAATAGLTGNSNLAIGTGNQDISAAQTQIGAANSGLSQDTTHQTADASARLSAAGQLNSDAGTGLTAGAQATSLANNNASLISSAGQQQQQDAQAQAAEAYQKYQLQNTYQQGVLNDYMSNITKPSGYYDATGSSTTTNTPPSSLGTLIAGGATALGSQFAKGGAFSATNADGTPNKNYIGNLFSGAGSGTASGLFDAAGTGTGSIPGFVNNAGFDQANSGFDVPNFGSSSN